MKFFVTKFLLLMLSIIMIKGDPSIEKSETSVFIFFSLFLNLLNFHHPTVVENKKFHNKKSSK